MVCEWHGGRSSTEESHNCDTVKQKGAWENIRFRDIVLLMNSWMEKNNDSVLHALTLFLTVLQMQEMWIGLQQQNAHLLASKPLEFCVLIFP